LNFHSGRVVSPGVPSPIPPTKLSLIGLAASDWNCWFSYQAPWVEKPIELMTSILMLK